MRETTPAQFAAAARAVVVAPAGCGKTELIVRAIATDMTKRDLVLTHTHAGVHAISDRLRRARIAKSRIRLDTIAGWALHLAASYPRMSGIPTLEPQADDWREVYAAAARLLDVPIVRDVVRNSYTGVYVDEYQDCVTAQHELILRLAELLPCRVVGDPLQSIFAFGQDALVSWPDVSTFFTPLPDLSTPHRWADAPALGEWLMYARARLIEGEAIDITAGPLVRVDPDPKEINNALRALRLKTSVSETGVAITGFAPQAHKVAQRQVGFYSLEPMDCPDLFKWADQLDAADPLKKAQGILEVAKQCFTKSSSLNDDVAALAKGSPLPPGKGKLAKLRAAVAALATNGTSDAVVNVLDVVHQTFSKVGRLYRKEAWDELRRSARSHSEASYETVRKAAWARRQATRSASRRTAPCSVGRPVLIKGLQFGHALVLNPDNCSREELYVSLTRGSKTLAIVSSTTTINPKA